MQARIPIFKNVISIIIIAFAFLFPHLGIIPIPFAYSIPVLLFIWFFLRWCGENFNDLGFAFKQFEIRAVLLGAFFAIVLFCFLNYLFFPALSKIFFLPRANLDDFKFVQHHLGNYLFILLMGWIIGGFYEELVFHGFIFTRIEQLFPGKYAVSIAFLLTNIIFGFYHIQLGLSGMLNAFLAGCAYHAILLRSKKNLWYSIFFHGFFDTIGLTFIYLGYWH